MSFIKQNAWAIGFVTILVLAFAAMAFTSKNTKLPSATATAKDSVDFVITPEDHVLGPENAKVTIVEFADFQCPACAAYFPIIEKLHQEFPNDLRIVYRYFPLTTIHLQALNSAYAAEAAGMQGKFWEMHSSLFSSQSAWEKTVGKSPFEKYATELGLDINKFKDDIGSSVVKNRVKKDLDYAIELGLNGTPSFYLNGKKIMNPGAYESFKAQVQAAISGKVPTQATTTP